MEGESQQQAIRPRESRKPDGQGGNRNRRSGSAGGGVGRKGVYRFDDQMEHAICQMVTHLAPKGFPAIGRSELATIPPVEVARTSSSILLCDNQHDGTHLWPNGDEVL